MILLTAAFPRALFPPETAKLYLEKLKHIPSIDLERAIHAWMERERYFPTIADLLSEWRVTRPDPPKALPEWDEAKDDSTPAERRDFMERLKRLNGKVKM